MLFRPLTVIVMCWVGQNKKIASIWPHHTRKKNPFTVLCVISFWRFFEVTRLVELLTNDEKNKEINNSNEIPNVSKKQMDIVEMNEKGKENATVYLYRLISFCFGNTSR